MDPHHQDMESNQGNMELHQKDMEPNQGDMEPHLQDMEPHQLEMKPYHQHMKLHLLEIQLPLTDLWQLSRRLLFPLPHLLRSIYHLLRVKP